MTDHDEQRDRTVEDDTGADIDDDVGSDPMHPHPQDRSLPDQTGDDDSGADQAGADRAGADRAGADRAGGGGGSPPGDVDDDSPVERYRDSPGLAVSDETRDVAEPNEPA